MRNYTLRAVAFSILLASLLSPAYAILGIGVHKGVDFSVDMSDATASIVFEDKRMVDPAKNVLDSSISYTLVRNNWQRTIMNFGGKFYIDVIPVIDAIELSYNLGIWEYEASLTYPVLSGTTISAKTQTLSVDSLGLDSRWGIGNVPYAKMHFDISVRKYIVRLPKKLNLLNLYAGGGFNLFLETPILTEELVRAEFGQMLPGSEYNMFDPNTADRVGSEGAMKNILSQVTEGFTEKQGGIHLTAGTLFQVPMVPLAMYADAKVMVPFAELGQGTLGGYGFVLNAGIALSISGERTSHTEGFE